jgi:hypothetical protein
MAYSPHACETIPRSSTHAIFGPPKVQKNAGHFQKLCNCCKARCPKQGRLTCRPPAGGGAMNRAYEGFSATPRRLGRWADL